MLSRREFLATTARLAPVLGGVGLGLTNGVWHEWLTGIDSETVEAAARLPDLIAAAPKARYWTSMALAGADCLQCHTSTDRLEQAHEHPAQLVQCQLCAQACAIKPGKRGKCRARINVGGELRSLVYGRPMAMHVDPIEKKPFYHFLPGSLAFSLATSGCPLHCKFCQNWELSQASPEDYQATFTPPEAIVQQAAVRQAPVLAYTYNEPTVFAEYLLDTAEAGKKRGLRSVIVSCGFMNERPLSDMCAVLDGIKIDLKGFSEDFYRQVSGGELQPVLRSIKQVARAGRHLEIVNLVVPTLNDTDRSLHGLSQWVADEVGPDVPVHFTRFHPEYQLLNLPETPVTTLERARAIAMDKGLHYVYVGNVPGHPGNHTYCPQCKKIVIERSGFFVIQMHLSNGRCAFCQHPIAGVWS